MIGQQNRPRWDGRAGFFEIWFLTVFDPTTEQAWWLRYTTFADRDGSTRATVWVSSFNARTRTRHSGKLITTVADGSGLQRTPSDDRAAWSGLQIGACRLAADSCSGRVRTGERTVGWDLTFTPAAEPAARGPAWLERIPAPTYARHVNSEITFTGHVEVDGVRHQLRSAPGLQKHLWGTRRVSQLHWLYCPQFEQLPGALEVTSVQPQPLAPQITPVWLRVGDTEVAWWQGLQSPGLLTARVNSSGLGRLQVHVAAGRHRLLAQAHCDPATLSGFVYRDPAGWDVYVAQSDVARCTVQWWQRERPWGRWGEPMQLTAPLAAVEFHARTPLPGVQYLPWDATHEI